MKPLKNILQEKYVDVYPNYGENMKSLIRYHKNAKGTLRNSKNVAHDEERLNMFMAEEKLLSVKISQFNETVDISSILLIPDAIQNYLTKMEVFQNEYFDVFKNIKCYMDDKQFETMYEQGLSQKGF